MDIFDASFIIIQITPADSPSSTALSSSLNEQFLAQAPKRARRLKREGTPAAEREFARAVIRTNHLPYDPVRGFVFGRQDDATDIVIGTIDQGVSQRHFNISYNWQAETLLLGNLSGNGTGWTDPETGQRETVRTSRVLLESKQYRVSAGVIDLILQIPYRDEHQQARYNVEFNRLRSESEKATPALDGIRIRASGKVTPMIVGVQRKYVLGSVVGHGMSAIVRKAFDYETGDRFAAKEYTCTSTAVINSMIREIRLLQKIKHAHIIEFVDIFQDPDPVVIMEFACSSLDRCNIRNTGECVTLLLHVLAGLQYLHNMQIVHRDIKPPNILLTGSDFWKLADFGLSKELKADTTSTFCGTPLYVAPEVNGLPHSLYTKAVDLWSLGVVGVEYSCGFGPAIKKPENEWCTAVLERAQVSELAATLVRMLDPNPGKRPSALEATLDLESCYRSGKEAPPLQSSLRPAGNSRIVSSGALPTIANEAEEQRSQETPPGNNHIDVAGPGVTKVGCHGPRKRLFSESIANTSRPMEADRWEKEHRTSSNCSRAGKS